MSKSYETQVTMEASEAFPSYEMKLYPVKNEFIACLELPNIAKVTNKVETVIILDRSGSMGNSVYKIVHSVLPLLFSKLSYDDDALIHLIAFECKTVLHEIKVGEFKTKSMFSAGGTYMKGAVSKLYELFEEFKIKEVTALRILTISDGEIGDQTDTKELGDKLADFAAQCNISVNSQAVRFFTSQCSPDTTALCSLLQLNNVEKSNLIDIKSNRHHDKIADEMSQLFMNDGFDKSKILSSSEEIFFKCPWDENGIDKLSLFPGKNIFWLRSIPKDAKIDGNLVKVSMQPSLTLDNFNNLLNSKLNFVIDRMKILKVIDTESAKSMIAKMVKYFTELESLLNESTPDETLDPKIIANRAKLIKLKLIRDKKISQFLSTIANDESVTKLNAEQKAAYLRSVEGTSKAGRGLAMRAAKKAKKGGSIVLSVDEIVRKEIKSMASNFHEISSIDHKTHSISFYSQATTFEGIQTIVDLSKDPSFDNFKADEILQILNIVGIACAGPIGDFPDASSWRVNEIYVGCYLSVADIITSHYQGGDSQALKAPGIDKEITNVIPVFDDPRIGIFLKKYAPSILEYVSSIGIRRVVADVPMTFGYTIIAGIRRLIYEMNKNKSTAHLDAFKNLIETAAMFVGKYYDHVEELLVDQSSRGTSSYYIDNNSLSSLIVPLIRVYKKKNHLNIPEILRSIYSCEIWKGIAKDFKGKSNFLDLAKESLFKLLNIDLEKHKVDSNVPQIDFYDDFEINHEYLDKLTQPLYYHNYMTLLPQFLQAAIDNKIEDIKNIPEMSKESIMKGLDVDYSYKEFLFLSIFQALRYPTKKSRADTDEKKMKIVDLKHKNEAIADVKNYVRLQFKQLYEKERKAKLKEEEKIVSQSIVDQITSSLTLTDALKLWRDGIEKNGITYKIKNSSSIGFKILSSKLCDYKIEVPLRCDLISVLLLGRDADGQIIYNHGEIYCVEKYKKFKQAFSLEKWNEIEEKINKKKEHVYRDKENRHGHHNERKSYFGFGHPKLIKYFEEVTTEEMDKYCEAHGNCCDAWNVQWALTHMRYLKEKERLRNEQNDDGENLDDENIEI